MVAAGFAAAPAAAAVNSLDNGSAEDVDVGQSSTLQEVSFQVDIDGAASSETINLDVSNVPSGVFQSVDSTEVTAGATDEVSASAGSVSSGTLPITVTDDTQDNTQHVATVTVTLEHDTTGQSPAYSVAIPINDGGTSSSTTTATFDLTSAEFNGADAGADSGSTFWQGQELAFAAPAGVGGVTASDTDFQIRSYDNTDDVIGGLENEFSIDNDNRTAVVDTSGLSEGDYVITPAGATGTTLTIGSNGVVTGSNSGGSASASDSWEVATQSLTVDLEDSEVNNDGTSAATELEFDSNRAGYTVDVTTADGSLDVSELRDIFENNGNYDVIADNQADDDDEVTVTQAGDSSAEGAADIDFSGIDAEDYDFEFNVSDSTASDAATVTVQELDVDASFSEGVQTDTAGDIANFTVELDDTDEIYVQFGDEEVGFIDILRLEDDDDDDEVSFQVNTRTLGTPGASNVYNSEDDIVESAIHDGSVSGAQYYDEEVDGANTFGSFDAYLNELGLIDTSVSPSEDPLDQLTRPLQAADYELSASEQGNFIINADGETEVDNEADSALLELTQPSIGDINTWVAPEDNADADDELSAVLDTVTQREEVALDDRAVIQVEASGLYGAIVEENGFDALEDGTTAAQFNTILTDGTYGGNWQGEGINFNVEADDATGNQEATSLDLTNSATTEVFVLYDEENGQFFLIADTSSDVFSQNVEDGDDFDVTMEYETDEDDRYEFTSSASEPYDGGGASTSDPAYPYFQTDSTVESTTSFTFAERSVTFDNVNDGMLEAGNTEGSTISGTTNVAPGSTTEVRVASTNATPSFRQTSSVDIAEDGSFSAEFDFSEQSSGDEFTTALRVAGSNVDSVDSTIVEDAGGAEATFEVSELSPQEATATAGDSVDVSATIENTGDAEGTQTVALTLDGDELDTQEVTLDAGNSTTVEFSADTSGLEAGDYEHGVATDDDEATGTLTIE
ncbi:BGTF surface domain-containing protein, partial [Haloarcula sp. AONF1]